MRRVVLNQSRICYFFDEKKKRSIIAGKSWWVFKSTAAGCQAVRDIFLVFVIIIVIIMYTNNNSNNNNRRTRAIKILYCTGNSGKFAEATIIVNNWVKERNHKNGFVNIVLVQAEPEIDEIQHDDERQISVQKCVSAYESVRYTGELTIDIDFVVTEDVGLRLNCLNGFPGAYIKPMMEKIGIGGLAKLVEKYDEEDRSAEATCSLAVLETSVAFKYPLFVEKCVNVFEGTIKGKIVTVPRGNVQHGKQSWNACFEVSNEEGEGEFSNGSTFGELSYEQQSQISHRKKAIEAFLNSINI